MLIGGDEDDDDPLDARSRSLFLSSAVVDSHRKKTVRETLFTALLY